MRPTSTEPIPATARAVGVSVRLDPVPEAAAPAVSAALESVLGAVSAFALEADGQPTGFWRIDGFAATQPDPAALANALTLAEVATGVPLPDPVVERLGPVDWVALTQASFAPIRVVRFFVHGSHIDARPPGSITIEIDAAAAFGTGEHATTRGCLAAIERLGHRRRARRILDVGTGSAILAIGAAKLFRRPVLGVEIDPMSVAIARHNVRANAVAGFVRVVQADGYLRRVVRQRRPFDLVLANVLARPLIRMAPALARTLVPGGRAVLSGLLVRQEASVLAAHRSVGLRLIARRHEAGWSTLVLGKGARSGLGSAALGR